MKISKIILLLSTFLIILGCEKKPAETPKSKQNIQEETKTELTLRSNDGKSIKLKVKKDGIIFEDFKNRVVLLNFFATWCPPCKAEIPHLISLQNRYKDKFTIISVVVEENKDKNELDSFINYYGINYIVANSKENFVLANLLGGVPTIPMMILYDKNGNYFTHYTGAVPEEMIEADLKRALKK